MRDANTLVALSVFPGTSWGQAPSVRLEKWMLKHVQHDGEF